MYGAAFINLAPAAFMLITGTRGLGGQRCDGSQVRRPHDAGDQLHTVAHDQLLRNALGHVGVGAGIVALHQLDLDARRQLVGIQLHVELDALVDLVALRGAGTAVSADQTDLDGLRGQRQRRQQRGGGQSRAQRGAMSADDHGVSFVWLTNAGMSIAAGPRPARSICVQQVCRLVISAKLLRRLQHVAASEPLPSLVRTRGPAARAWAKRGGFAINGPVHIEGVARAGSNLCCAQGTRGLTSGSTLVSVRRNATTEPISASVRPVCIISSLLFGSGLPPLAM